MFPPSSSIDEVISAYEKPSDVLRNLYLLFKRHNKKYSVAFFCKKAGVSSKGYFAYFMDGRRHIPFHLWNPICDAFQLNEQQAWVFKSKIKHHWLSAKQLREESPLSA